MSHYYAQINDESICFAVTETAGEINAPDMISVASLDQSLLGKKYENGQFVAPPEPPAPPPPAYQWYIDIGPFFDRFGATKMAVLTSSDVGVRALITDIQVRKWIDLKLPEVAQSLTYLGSVIPAVTPALQSSILNTPVGDQENLALRKLYFNA